jgi:hypothetical protein
VTLATHPNLVPRSRMSRSYIYIKVSHTHHSGAEGKRCSSYSFLISELDLGEWPASLSGRPLPPVKGPPLPIGQEIYIYIYNALNVSRV